ncbi:hypothetical protein D3C81_1757240 [compost metagenome]
MRDSRITQIYEGTNGIQALDFIRRKLLADGGQQLTALQDELDQWCARHALSSELSTLVLALETRVLEWRTLTTHVIAISAVNVQEIGACSVDFLQYSAYVLLAGFWLQAAARAEAAMAAGTEEVEFYRAKLNSARFYSDRILPRASAHREAVLAGAESLMAMPETSFAF